MRYWLKVPYHQREQAKSAGCRWNPERKLWYVDTPFRGEPIPLTINDFSVWKPKLGLQKGKRHNAG